jgi:peroxiredoxin
MSKRAGIVLGLCALIAAGAASRAQAPGTKTAPVASAPLPLGSPAPAVSLLINGRLMSLKSLLAGNRTLVLFYRGACTSCDSQLQAIDKGVIQALGRMGFAAFAVSPDLPAEQAQTVGRLSLPYTVLSDPNGAAARAFHVPGSAAFLIDRDGTIQFASDLDSSALTGAQMIDAARALKRSSKNKS